MFVTEKTRAGFLIALNGRKRNREERLTNESWNASAAPLLQGRPLLRTFVARQQPTSLIVTQKDESYKWFRWKRNRISVYDELFKSLFLWQMRINVTLRCYAVTLRYKVTILFTLFFVCLNIDCHLINLKML